MKKERNIQTQFVARARTLKWRGLPGDGILTRRENEACPITCLVRPYPCLFSEQNGNSWSPLPHISPLPVFFSPSIHSLPQLSERKRLREELNWPRHFSDFSEMWGVFVAAFNGRWGGRRNNNKSPCCPSRTVGPAWLALGRTCPSSNGARIGHSLSKEWLMTGPLCSTLHTRFVVHDDDI